MSADLLDDVFVEVTGVAQEATGDVVCVLDTLKDVLSDWVLGALAKLSSCRLGGNVCVLHPELVCRCSVLINVLLEDDNVGIWDGLRVRRGDDWSSILVDGLSAKWGCQSSSGNGQRDKSCLHDDDSLRRLIFLMMRLPDWRSVDGR